MDLEVKTPSAHPETLWIRFSVVEGTWFRRFRYREPQNWTCGDPQRAKTEKSENSFIEFYKRRKLQIDIFLFLTSYPDDAQSPQGCIPGIVVATSPI